MMLANRPSFWAQDVRTPLGLIEEPDGSGTLFYTAYEKSAARHGYGCVGVLKVRITLERLYRLPYLHRGEHGIRSALDLYFCLWLTLGSAPALDSS